jgi:hypothetical protein
MDPHQALMNAKYPFQVDVTGHLTDSMVRDIFEFCQPLDILSRAAMRGDGTECLRVGFVSPIAAAAFSKRFDGQAAWHDGSAPAHVFPKGFELIRRGFGAGLIVLLGCKSQFMNPYLAEAYSRVGAQQD